MILGYEQPVDIPVMSIYDKDMMKMYLGALQKDYEQGLADQKEFNKMAGDFYSPISKDNESWYNITTKPILDYLNLNPNAIRSVEGRAMIRNFINSRPYGEMANLRQSADNAKLFVAAVNKMKQDGTYSQDLADYLHETLDGWDTYGNKTVWDKTAPTRYVGMEEALLPTVQMLQKSMRVDEEKSKKHPGFIISNVSKQQADDAINKAYGDLLKIPAMQYHLAKSGLDEAGFKNLLAEQALSQTGEKWDPDQLYMLNLKLKAEAAEGAKERALKRQLAKGKDDKEKLQNPMLTTKIEQRTFSKMGQVHAPVFEKYMRTRAANAKDPNEKKMFEGYAEEWKNYSKLSDEKKMEFLRKYGYLDENGLTDKYFTWFGMANGVSRGNKVQSRQLSRRNAYEYYQSHLAEIESGEEAETLIEALSGSTGKQRNGYYGVTFGGKISYTPVRALNFSGHSSIMTNRKGLTPQNSIEYQFSNFLNGNKIHANVYDTSNLKAGRLPGKVLEVSGMRVTVPYSEIRSFIEQAKSQKLMLSNGKTANNATEAQILKDLGITFVTPEGKAVSTTVVMKKQDDGTMGEDHSSTTTKGSPVYYAVIDASGTFNADGTTLSGLNDAYNKRITGAGKAFEEIMNSYIEAERFGNK